MDQFNKNAYEELTHLIDLLLITLCNAEWIVDPETIGFKSQVSTRRITDKNRRVRLSKWQIKVKYVEGPVTDNDGGVHLCPCCLLLCLFKIRKHYYVNQLRTTE
jgi:hypothetical protein